MNSPFLRLCSFALILSAGLSSCQKEKNYPDYQGIGNIRLKYGACKAIHQG